MFDWKTLVEMIAPIILGSDDKTKVLVPFVVQGIQTAEGMAGASGAAKLEAAKSLVHVGVAAANEEKPGLIDPSTVDDAVAKGISTTVDVVNLIHRQVQPALVGTAAIAGDPSATAVTT